jgi:hypothetical protein
MSAKTRWFGLLALVAVIATGAAAQKNEIAGGIGRIFIPDQTIKAGPVAIPNNVIHSGNGLTWEFNYARHLLHPGFIALDAEVPVVGNPDEDLGSGNGAVPKTYSSIFVTPAARLRFFADNAVQLWVSGGGGFGHWTISNTLVYGGVNPGPKSKNAAIAQAGAGLDLRAWKHFGFRLAARDFYTPQLPLNVITTSSHHHNIVVTGGVIFSFGR